LNDHFEGDPFLAGQDWDFLQTRADIVEILDAFFVEQTPLRPALPAALTKYLDPVSDAAPSLADLAEQVTKAIEEVAPEIWDNESDRVVYALRAEMAGQLAVSQATLSNTEALLEQTEAIRGSVEVAQAGGFDALPEEIRPYLDRLAEEDADAARRLRDVLLVAPAIKEGVIGLIAAPQAWISETKAPGSVLAVLGRLAAHFGSWEEAETAFLAADDAGYHRRANTLARASEAAQAQGKTDEAQELLDRAEALDQRDATVSILVALRLTDADEKLARLAEADSKTNDEEAAVEANRAFALLGKNEIEAAHAAALLAVERNPHFIYGKIVLGWVKNRRGAAAAPAGNQDIDDLRGSATLLLSAGEALDSVGRHSEALALVSDICYAYFLAREQLRAVSLLEEVAADGEYLARASAEARNAVADVAITLQRPDLVERFLAPDIDSEEGRLTSATMRVISSEDPEEIAAGAKTLEELLSSSDTGIRGQAALMRLAAATRTDGVDWSDEAERVLRESGNVEPADGLRAQYLVRRGRTQEAENILLQSDSPRSRELLISMALEAGDTGLAIQRSEALVREYPSPARRLALAELLIGDNRPDEAEPTLAALRRDERVPLDVRDRAYYLSVRKAYRARRYDETEQLTAEWLELVPSETDAAWVRLESLLWLSRYGEALALIADSGLEPDTIEKARLLAHVFLRALPPAEALEKIIELSDRFDRSDDRLEGLIIICYANSGDDIPEELARRGQSAIAEFAERFPDSKANARSVSLEEMNEILRQKREHDVVLGDISNDVLAGRLPLAVLAMVARQSLTALWTSLRVLPIAFADPAVAAAELAAAEAAIGAGAVWDPSALVTTGLLDQATTTAIEQALPRSVLTNAALQDVDYAAVDAAEGRAEEEQSLAWDEELQQPVLLVRDPEEVARERQRVRHVLARARGLEVAPDVDEEHSTPFDGEIPEITDLESMGRAVLFGSMAVAARLGLPLYSDDRVIRVLALQAGLPTFGTLAIIDALASRGLLTDDAKDRAREALVAAGALELSGKT
jgi:tetratricopeptide (TPR) repeat protein